ncbi:hypothetical protein DFQ27_008515 [Actinomortierella ambigua]|uniref:Uncharacterized protein n=1 Tax=Actinomortierella ambigua TaxID=1343610 RepID=A0A9P6PTN3_9FUNG|nr:hypothetical protein DFQ27_008515 [Actinomortierella ambigua]
MDIDALSLSTMDSHSAPDTRMDIDVDGLSMSVQYQQQQLQQHHDPALVAMPFTSAFTPIPTSAIPDEDISYASIFAGAYTRDVPPDQSDLVLDLPDLSELFDIEPQFPPTQQLNAADLPLTYDDAAFIEALLAPELFPSTMIAELYNTSTSSSNYGQPDVPPSATTHADQIDHNFETMEGISSQGPDDNMLVDTSTSSSYPQHDSNFPGMTGLSYPLLLTRGVDQSIMGDPPDATSTLSPPPVVPLNDPTPRMGPEESLHATSALAQLIIPSSSFATNYPSSDIYFSPQVSPLLPSEALDTPYLTSEPKDGNTTVVEDSLPARTLRPRPIKNISKVPTDKSQPVQSQSPHLIDEPSSPHTSSTAGTTEALKLKAVQSRNSFMLFRSLVSFIHTKAHEEGCPAIKQVELSNALGKLWIEHHPINARFPKTQPNHDASGCADCAIKKLFASASVSLVARDVAIFLSAASLFAPSASLSTASNSRVASGPWSFSTLDPDAHLNPMDVLDWTELEQHHRESALFEQVLTAMKKLKNFPQKATTRRKMAMLKSLWREHELEHEKSRRDDIKIKANCPKSTSELAELLAEDVATNEAVTGP